MASAASHVGSMDPAVRAVNGFAGKAVDSARSIAGKRGDWRPIPGVRERIVRDFERGLSFRSLGKRYVGVGVEALEGVVRDYLRAAERAMRQAGVAAAASVTLLMGLSVWDSWEAAVRGDVAVERGFRGCGRARKRGLEDSSCLIELPATASIAA